MEATDILLSLVESLQRENDVLRGRNIELMDMVFSTARAAQDEARAEAEQGVLHAAAAEAGISIGPQGAVPSALRQGPVVPDAMESALYGGS